MNKKLKFIIAGVAIVAGLASAVSCKDYSKDLDDLSVKVTNLESKIAALENEIKAGSVITAVNKTSDGIEIVLSNGQKHVITNGKDGANGKDGTNGTNGKDGDNGTVWTIGDDGFWYKDGEKTEFKAVGTNGTNGKDGDSIVWKFEDGKLVEYKNGEKTGEVVDIVKPGTLTAVWDAEKGILTLFGVEGAEEGLPIILSNKADAPAAISLADAYSAYANYNTWEACQGYYVKYWYVVGFDFSNVIEQENVFEEGIKNAITFEKGRQTPIGARIVVRVSPANYVLKEDDISFVNSLGVVFEKVKAVNVAPYTGLLTKASTAETGLWAVDVILTDYNKKEFNSYSGVDTNKDGVNDRYISYAVKAQEAVSSYDLCFDYHDFIPSNYLDLFVGENSIAEYNNRYQGNYTGTSNPSLQKGGEITYEELTWAASSTKFPTPATEISAKGENVIVDAADNRSTLPTYKAVLGEEIPITAVVWDGSKYVANQNVVGIYVTFDFEENAIESAPSEWNAWVSYTDGIEGLNEVFEGNQMSITINDPKADGDVIGFRVYAVNADGTLLDPDGRAFYVQVGKSGTEIGGVNTVMNTIEQFKAKKSGDAKVSISNKISTGKWAFSMKAPASGRFQLLDKDNKVLAYGYSSIKGNTYTISGTTFDLSKITKANFAPDGELYLWEDGKTYEGLFTFYNSDDFVVATLPVTFTKELPTSIAEVPVKTGQLGADGIYRCFLVPANWKAYDKVADAEADGQKGTMDMLSIFNFPKDDPKGYEVTFASSKKTVKDGKAVLVDVTVKPTKTLAEDAALDAPENTLTIENLDLIDNKTEHTTTVNFNMGKVSSALVTYNDDGSIKSVKDYVLNAGSFPTIYFCIYNKDAKYGWSWNWKMTKAQYEALFVKTEYSASKIIPAILYEDFDGKTIDPTYIDGKSLWDGKYTGTMPTGYDNTIKVSKVELVTSEGANKGKIEYYNVDTSFKFTKKSGATNPTAPVASTLVVTYTDMYGHKETCEMPAKVMPRK